MNQANSSPRVSIVMPVHNGSAFLDAAIRSVRDQQFGDFELICVDDASSDATPAILARHAAADARIRIVTLERNHGLPGALNRGFAHARGSLLSWTSDDNILRPQMLGTLVSALDADPGAGLAYAGYTVIDAGGTPIRYQPPAPVGEQLFRNIVGAAFLYRAELARTVGGYDEALFGVEDYDYWLRAARHFRFVRVAEDLYLYRRHPRSLTDMRARQIKDRVVALIRRELRMVDDRRLAAKALLGLVTQDLTQLRFGLVAEAARLAPGVVMRATPGLIRFAAFYARLSLTERTAGARAALVSRLRPALRARTTPRPAR